MNTETTNLPTLTGASEMPEYEVVAHGCGPWAVAPAFASTHSCITDGPGPSCVWDALDGDPIAALGEAEDILSALSGDDSDQYAIREIGERYPL